MSAKSLQQLYTARPGREGRDRLEILTTLINGPSFDPVFAGSVIRIPRGHPVYRWECVVQDCERTRAGGTDLCSAHMYQWKEAREAGTGKAAFLTRAEPLSRHVWADQEPCRLCPGRPATSTRRRLCRRHNLRWHRFGGDGEAGVSFEEWLAGEEAFDGYGGCRVVVCPSLAASPLGLCSEHEARYDRDGRPGGVALPEKWWYRYERLGLGVPVAGLDGHQFRDWCARRVIPEGQWS